MLREMEQKEVRKEVNRQKKKKVMKEAKGKLWKEKVGIEGFRKEKIEKGKERKELSKEGNRKGKNEFRIKE